MAAKQLFFSVLISIVTVSAIKYGMDPHGLNRSAVQPYTRDPLAHDVGSYMTDTRFPLDKQPGDIPADFMQAARSGLDATVHIRVRTGRSGNSMEVFEQPVAGSGSGVLISPNGYLVTNAHVVEGAEEIRVTLNNRRSFPAVLVAADRFQRPGRPEN